MSESSIVVRHIEGDHFAVGIRGHEIEVDQPAASGGTDAAPTPSELFIASLASCAAFYAGRFLRRHLGATGAWSVRCTYHWSEERRSYIDRVEIGLVLPVGISDEVRDGAIRAADHCTVRESIRWGVDVRVTGSVPEPALA